MEPTGRRTFLGAAGMGAGAPAAGNGAARAASGRVVVGVIGPGGMGSHHIRHLAARKDVEIAYVCDPDAKRLEQAVKLTETGSGKAPKAVKDLRKVLDNGAVDA